MAMLYMATSAIVLAPWVRILRHITTVRSCHYSSAAMPLQCGSYHYSSAVKSL